MSTEKQILASRANGAKSRGPVSPEGKRNSSRNSLRHGMLARTVVLDGESRDRFNELFKSLVDEFQPVTAVENILIQKMAVAHWRQMRLWNVEKVSIDLESAKPAQQANTDPCVRDAIAMRSLNSTPSHFEMRYDRQFDRALNRFVHLRQRRALSDNSPQTNPPGSGIESPNSQI